MNIYYIYDKNEIKFENKINELKDYIEENKNTYKIKTLTKLTSKTNCDIYIILSDDLDETNKQFEKLEEKEKVLIITSNISTSHILGCIDITSNVTYLGNSPNVILKRINNIYEKTKNK